MCALQPPFRANDMNGLFKAVTAGRIQPLPAQDSKDMMYVIKLCLQLKPELRPSCIEFLKKSQLVKNTPSSLSLDLASDPNLKLIGTIKVPRNIGAVTNKLPASQYEETKGGMSR